MNVADGRYPEAPPQIETFEFDLPSIAEEGQESKIITPMGIRQDASKSSKDA